MTEELRAVIAANKEQRGRAAELNVRAGEKIFSVPTEAELAAWLMERLPGVRSQAGLADPETVRLSPLDEELVALVQADNPDTLEVVGRSYAVVYRAGYPPTITMEGEDVTVDRIWWQLPDDGVRLPGGRLVAVTVRFGWTDYRTETDLIALKTWARERANRGQWDAWPKPEIAPIDPDIETATIPEIALAEYGRCVIDNTPLQAWGVVAYQRPFWSSTKPTFQGEWFRDQVTAQAKRQEATEKLAEWQTAQREKQELAAAKEAASIVQRHASEMRSRHGGVVWLTAEQRQQLSDACCANLNRSATELRQWMAETQTLIETIAAAALAYRQKETARRLAENAPVRAVARPILSLGETEGEETVYGVPCNEEGPCPPAQATGWRLYSREALLEAAGAFVLVPHKGYRSRATGRDLWELVENYLEGDDRLDAVLDALEAAEEAAKPQSSSEVPGSSAGKVTAADLAALQARFGKKGGR